MNSFGGVTGTNRVRNVMVSAMFLILAACSTALAETASTQRHLSAVSLQVTVNTTQHFDPLNGNLTDVSPDSSSPYIDDQKGVCASFDTSGDLIINFACARTSTPRQLGLNLPPIPLANPGGNSCTPPTTISPSNPPAYTNYIATVGATDMPTSAFQTMNVYDGTTKTIYYVQFFIGYSLSDASQTTWRLNYHRTTSSSFADAALGSYAEVRRLSPTEWVVESVTPSSLTGNPPNAAMLVETTSTRHSTITTECGFYQVPFSFTLDQN